MLFTIKSLFVEKIKIIFKMITSFEANPIHSVLGIFSTLTDNKKMYTECSLTRWFIFREMILLIKLKEKYPMNIRQKMVRFPSPCVKKNYYYC